MPLMAGSCLGYCGFLAVPLRQSLRLHSWTTSPASVKTSVCATLFETLAFPSRFCQCWGEPCFRGDPVNAQLVNASITSERPLKHTAAETRRRYKAPLRQKFSDCRYYTPLAVTRFILRGFDTEAREGGFLVPKAAL